MGFQLLIGGDTFEMVDFSATEASSPLSAGDSSGQVGTINLTVKRVDLNDFAPASIQDGNFPGDPVSAILGSQMLIGKDIRLTDTRKGFTLGRVSTVSDGLGGTFSLTCESRLGLLNVFDIQAEPFVGTLSGAFHAYMGLAGISTDIFIDPAIANVPVVFPGWYGELWLNLKNMAASLDVELSLVSGVILLRPIRSRVSDPGKASSESFSIGGSLAQFVEVYHYNNRAINNELVYPIGGWSEDVSVINVNAGESVEEVLTLSASMSSIQQPTMQTFVSREHSSSSVFTVVGDDGLPISPVAWSNSGGSLSVEINPDTVSLTVKIQAPTKPLPNKSGEAIGVYSISLSSDASTGRYSTLRIIGTGVAFDKQLVRFPTGVPASKTATEVGETIDNPFISSLEQLYTAGSRAAKRYKGTSLQLTSEVIAVNQLGDSGIATYPSYLDVKESYGSRTYGQVKTLNAGKTYAKIQSDLVDSMRDDFANQVFGNVAGARIYSRRLLRWFRIREGTLNAGKISVSGDDDLLYGDIKRVITGRTYKQEREMFSGLTYQERNLAGMYWKA